MRTNKYLDTMCENGDINEVKAIVISGAITKYDCETLCCAFRGGNIELIDLIYKMCKKTNNRCDLHDMWLCGIECACKKGNLQTVKWYVNGSSNKKLFPPYNFFENCLQHACQSGNIHLVNFIINKGVKNWNFGLNGACIGGHIEIVKYMISKGANQLDHALVYACKGGHTKIAEFIAEQGATDWNTGLVNACYHGHVEMVKYIASKKINTAWVWCSCLFGACHINCLEIVQIVFDNITVITEELLNTSLIKLLCNIRYDVNIIILLINKGANIDSLNGTCLKYLRSTKNPKLYCLCCKKSNGKYVFNINRYIELLQLYPPYVLLVMSRSDKKICTSKLPSELFRLLFKY